MSPCPQEEQNKQVFICSGNFKLIFSSCFNAIVEYDYQIYSKCKALGSQFNYGHILKKI